MSNFFEAENPHSISELELGDQRLKSLQALLDPKHDYAEEQESEWKVGEAGSAAPIKVKARISLASQETRRLRMKGVYLLRNYMDSLGRIEEADAIIDKALGYPSSRRPQQP